MSKLPSILLSLSLVACGGTEVTLRTDTTGPRTVTNTNTNTNAIGLIEVDLGPDFVVSQGDVVDLVAIVSGEGASSDLTYAWSQHAGVAIDEAPTGALLSFVAPGEVTTLSFEVEVRDAAAPDNVSVANVHILVARDATDALFVDADHGDDGNDGSFEHPVQTLAHAVTLAEPAGLDLYLNNPDVDPAFTLDVSLVLPDGVAVFGGFDVDWLRHSDVAPTRIDVLQPTGILATAHTEPVVLSGIEVSAHAPVAGDLDSVAIELIDVPEALLDRVVARGSDLATDPARSAVGFAAGSSFGVRAVRVTQLDLVQSVVIAGQGASGPGGLPGSDGGIGANGGSSSSTLGGVAGASNHNGKSGGAGGDADSFFASTCAGGANGSTGSSSTGATGGSGGWGATTELVWYFPNPLPYCIITGSTGGSSVWSTATSGGAGTVGQLGSGLTAEGRYLPTNGGAGAQGHGGAGGGGGGSGASGDTAFWMGGGGGGGGEGGEGGDGGTGGASGGGLLRVGSHRRRDHSGGRLGPRNVGWRLRWGWWRRRIGRCRRLRRQRTCLGRTGGCRGWQRWTRRCWRNRWRRRGWTDCGPDGRERCGGTRGLAHPDRGCRRRAGHRW